MLDWPWLLATLLAYLSGSIPFALLIGLAHGVDLRTVGSGNIGATNCAREVGRRWGILCFVLDMLKGVVPVVGAGWWFGLLGGSAEAEVSGVGWWIAVAAAPVVGHVAPVWLRFRGGKGVATGFGAVLGMWPYLTLPALLAALVWVGSLRLWRYVSLSSVLAAASLPVWFVVAAVAAGWSWPAVWPLLAITVAMAGVVIARHEENLRRLAAGTEGKLGE